MNPDFRTLMNERFGMFVHYGIYSALGGKWNGKSVDGLGEWIQLNGEIPNAEYEAFAKKHFLPSPNFAKNLVSSAKKAGVRYIVLTAKHHDGFCLFKSEVDSYNTFDFYGRDICRELADECKKEGIKLGFYYSHTLDWHEKNGAGNVCRYSNWQAKNRNYWDFPDDGIDFEQYFRDKCIPQVKELLTNYGPLELIWFDFPHDITETQSIELRQIVKEIQPKCLINSRIAHGLHDYVSLGDNQLPITPTDTGIECLVTLNHTWGFKYDDSDWKSPESIISILTRTLGCNSTLLLNVGPMGDGSLTPETEFILDKIGEWTKRNGDAIYGNVSGNPFPAVFDFGQVALKENKLFLYLNDESDEKIFVGGIETKPRKIYLLGSGEETEFSYIDTSLSFLRAKRDGSAPVYCLEFDTPPMISPTITQNGDLISLNPTYACKIKTGANDSNPTPLERVDFLNGVASCDSLSVNSSGMGFSWHCSDEVMVFDAEITKDGTYEAELIHLPADQDVSTLPFSVAVDGVTNSVQGEKRHFAISKTGSFNSMIVRDAGKFDIKRGKRKITLKKLFDESDVPIVELRLKRIK